MNDLQIDTFFVINLNTKFVKWYRQYDFMYITSKNNEKIFQGNYVYDKTINKDVICSYTFLRILCIYFTQKLKSIKKANCTSKNIVLHDGCSILHDL